MKAIIERVDKQQASFEQRVERRLNDIEARLREFESRMAKNKGTVSGALAQAFANLLQEERNRTTLHRTLAEGTGASDKLQE